MRQFGIAHEIQNNFGNEAWKAWPAVAHCKYVKLTMAVESRKTQP